MPIYPRALFTLIAASALLSSCSTYDPPPQASKPVPADVDTWQKISTKSWVIPPATERSQALIFLDGRNSMQIDAKLCDQLTTPPEPEIPRKKLVIPKHYQLYLVRGRGYGTTGGKIRFQPKTRELSVSLATYNGEMLMPGAHWAVGDIPVIVALPSAPAKVHQSAQLGGDGILRSMDLD